MTQKTKRRGRKTNAQIQEPIRKLLEQSEKKRKELETLINQILSGPKSPGTETDQRLNKFERFLNIVRGRVDIKRRLRILLDPDNILTTTRLTTSQVDFVSLSYFVSNNFKESGFSAFQEYARLFMLANISLRGLGREEAIQYEGAIGETKLLKNLNIFRSDQTQKDKAIET